MCVISVSARGKRQPTEKEIRQMFAKNPHGAGLMWATGKDVRFTKGLMDVESLLDEIKSHKFTSDDVVVYHFRISTQGGVKKEMTQPFPLVEADDYKTLLKLSGKTKIGMAHNGIIPLTDDPTDNKLSDTAIFVAEYLPYLIGRDARNLKDQRRLRVIEELIGASKLAFLSADGEITTVGNFVNCNGLMCSNNYWVDRTVTPSKPTYSYQIYKTSNPSWKRQLVESARRPDEKQKLNFV